MNKLIQADEAAKLAENGTTEVRNYIITELDKEIRKHAIDGTRMKFNLYTRNAINSNHGSIVRNILQDAGYTVMNLKYVVSPDPRDMGITWFDVDICSRPAGNYMTDR
ncbi:hypothetical protein NVP2275O_330 [Vibrio phage 2.275.O._10N.286.54.E11]|nr:hypothetical protein NVP2275O_330 [Vibrio phage 2.275.O._10N.286.54.E11]